MMLKYKSVVLLVESLNTDAAGSKRLGGSYPEDVRLCVA